MYNNIKTPENHPEKEQLEKVAKTLLEFLPLHSIYFSLHNEDLGSKTIITIFLSDECELDYPDVKPFVEKVFQSYPAFSFVLMHHNVGADLLDDGYLFYMLHATVDELAFTSDPSNVIFSFKKSEAKKMLRKAKSKFAYYDCSARSFLRNVTFYERHENYLQAAFHIHQALQMMYLILSKLLKGDYEECGNLISLQRSFQDFAPTLKLFDIENAEEYVALEQLNNSLRAVKYNEKHEFTREAIELAWTKTKDVMTEANALFKKLLKKCKKKMKAVTQRAEAEESFTELNGNLKINAVDKNKTESAINRIKEISEAYLTKLEADKHKKGIFNVKVSFDDYFKLFTTIEDLVQISLHTLYNDGSENSGTIENPSQHVISVLEIIAQLLPIDEAQALDEMRMMLLEVNENTKDEDSDDKELS